MIGNEFSEGVTKASHFGSWSTCHHVHGKPLLEKPIFVTQTWNLSDILSQIWLKILYMLEHNASLFLL